ncbi:phosphatidylinositol 4-kinase alpha 1-like isoform X2 [Impatiens glandulifera]|uniref:phosphatidylinositol 4-kinase alpha 1-like isoform X2 n=1 Tax=Impatiens glandulifera TaxID=253017 RepID=UPI001FB135C1|nr:phosphatidylinositol 4-kinase alpha 1-like isoform X2 [Impatiens glandulifera]
MEPLIELCDLVAKNPNNFREKLSWMCGRCPTPEGLISGSPCVTRPQLNAVIAVARFLSKCPDHSDIRPESLVLGFLRSVPASFSQSFWPNSFGEDAIASSYKDFLGYVVKATELSEDFASEVAECMGEILISAVSNVKGDLGICRSFLRALAHSFLPILPQDGDKLITCLFDNFVSNGSSGFSPGTVSSSTSSPASRSQQNGRNSPRNGVSMTSGSSSSAASKVADDATTASSRGSGMNGGRSADNVKRMIASFEEESLESLEKQEIAFTLITHILDKAEVDIKLVEVVMKFVTEQLQLMLAFLKIRKSDWTEQGPQLKARVNAKISVYQAAAKLKVKSLSSLNLDAKASKHMALRSASALIDGAKACLSSVWRKLRVCEELFSSLLALIGKIALTREGQQLRVLLIHFKILVQEVCLQVDTCGASQGVMFESVLKTSCQIIEFGWNTDRSPIDTFILGLATSIRDRNDYESQDGKEKQVAPIMQLNIIRLLADLTVSVKKPEVVDMILPLFIECLEEGDASTPGLMRLRLLDAVSYIASLGFEKSYRETIVLLTRGYLSKLSSVESTESKTLAPEATTERVETLPAGLLLIAKALTNSKLRSDYRHRLLSLCSDVGLAAESKSGRSGADFLGPLLPAVAEICSDFVPSVDVEPSLLKLFRNLWFYIALFGLAPPVEKNQVATKSVSATLTSVGSMGSVAFQAVGGPYMWSSDWSVAVQRIAQGTPPLVVSSVKWLEDELELNALHNPGSRRGNGNEKAAVTNRTALSAALGGRVEVAAMSTISGVKATYLLAVAFLEIIRFSSNGGILNGDSSIIASRSAFSCAFEYLKTPNLIPSVSQSLTAVVHQAYEAAILWLEGQISETGDAAEIRESVLSVHASFLIKSMSQREENIRNLSISLLTRLRDKFPQILWNSSCLDSLLFSVPNESPSLVNDPAMIATIRSLFQKIVGEWIIVSLSFAPCTTQGLLQVIRHDSVEQLLLLGRLLQGTTNLYWNFSRHPAATGTFFTLMLFGLKFCSCQSQSNLQNFRMGLQLLEDRIYRASLGWFAYEPEWYDINNTIFSQIEAQSVSVFVHHLQNEHTGSPLDPKGRVRENGSSFNELKDQYHPVWGHMENYEVGRNKRKQLLLMLCQHESDRLEVWAQPTNSKESTPSRPKITSDKWIEYARTAFAVDPRIAFCLVSRFPTNAFLKAEMTQLVQVNIVELRSIPEALPYFVTPKAVDENSPLLQQLPHWAACSITQAFEFLTPQYKGHPRIMAYVLRALESYPPERVTFFMPQLVQALRYDEGKLVEGYLVRAAHRNDTFAHILIWQMEGELVPESGKDPASGKNSSFQAILPIVKQRIIDGFNPKARDMYEREFDFIDKVTSISGVLFPLPKEERRAGIKRELEKIELNGEDLYLPTDLTKFVRGIQVDSGIPLQSAAKVPIMITFNVVDRHGDHNDLKPLGCIFKVGDDCRQDLLALQVISLLKDIFDAIGLKLYLCPYGVLPTGPERGIIEVVANSRSRSQMGETTDGGLYEIFQQDYGPVGSPSFEAARQNFIVSSAGYAVASLLLQPKDRHNGNLLFDNFGRLVHIDFGFILETSPGGNMRFESAHFKLSHEMTQLLDPSGVMKSETWYQFVGLCVKGYLAARRYMDGIINTVLLMIDSGLPCFSRGDPIGNLRKRFHPEMSEREAANFMIRICTDAYNKWTTAGYDLIQYLQQGIEK